jgi:hypothetical protein
MQFFGTVRHLIALVLSLVPSLAGASFISPITTPVPGGLHSMAAADMNGDGRDDLIALQFPTYALVFLSTADGQPGTVTKTSIGADWVGIIAPADFNGDGKMDIVVTTFHGLALLLGDGQGGLTPASQTPLPDQPFSVTTADFDGDGNVDAAVTIFSQDAPKLSICPGRGDGTFGTPVSYPSASSSANVVAADFTGDGKADVVTSGGDSVLFYANAGNGTFGSPQQLPVTPFGGLAALDVDRDGRIDIIVATMQGVRALRNAGGQRFDLIPQPLTDTRGGALFKGDIDDDGAVDLIVNGDDSGGGLASAWLANGDGTFRRASAVATTAFVTVGHFHQQGALDLAINTNTGRYVAIARGRGDGSFDAPVPYSVHTTFDRSVDSQFDKPERHAVATADFDGDGHSDVAVTNMLTNDVSIRRGRGDGSLGEAVNYAVGNRPAGIAAADLDGDGRPEVIVTHRGTSEIFVLRNDGNGTFTTTARMAGPTSDSISVADVNGDGKADLLVCSPSTNVAHGITLFLGHGDTTFSSSEVIIVDGSNYGVGVVTADFDRDGKLDLVVPLVRFDVNQKLAYLKGHGDGTFDAPRFMFEFGAIQGIASGDFNRDGAIDFAVSTEYGPFVVTWINNGDGTFRRDHEYPSGLEPRMIVARDFDGDGVVDLAGVDRRSYDFMFFRGAGDGSFAAAEHRVAGSNASTIAVADFNEDGLSDLVIGNEYSAMLIVLNCAATSGTVSVTAPASVCAGEDSVVATSSAAGYWTIANGTITSGQGTSSIRFQPDSGRDVSLYVTAASSGCPGPIGKAHVSVAPQPGATLPPSTTICRGTSITLRAQLTGTAPFTVRWSDGLTQSNLSTSLATRAVSPASSTTYSIVSINDAQCANTAPHSAVRVTVLEPPSIVEQPHSVTASSGQNVTLSVNAIGSALFYQWFRGAAGDERNPLGTERTQTVVATAGAMTYWVKVIGVCDTLYSEVATVSPAQSRRRVIAH